MNVRQFPPRAPKDTSDGSWGRHWLGRSEQRRFRNALLQAAGPNPACALCHKTGIPLEAHHVTVDSGMLLCRSCHVKETQANQLNGYPPPLALPDIPSRGLSAISERI